MTLENEELTSDQIAEEQDIVKLLFWKFRQIIRTTTARLGFVKNKNLKTEQHYVAQKGLLDLLSTRIKILEIKEELEFTEDWDDQDD